MSPGKCIHNVQGYYLYRSHNYLYLLRFKVLMEPIILVFIKLMGAVIRGGSRICGRGGGAAAVPFEDPLWNFKRGAQGACALFGPPWRPSLEFQKGGRAPCGPPLNPLVVISGHWDLRDTGTTRDNDTETYENVHIPNSSTPIVSSLVWGDSWGIALTLRG